MSCRDIAKPSQQESSGDNVYDKLRKRLLRHSLVEKSQHYSQVNHLVKNSPQFPRYCFSSRMGWWSEPSLPLIRPSSMTLRRHSLISLSGERNYGERDGWVERGTRILYLRLFKVSFQRPWHVSNPDLLAQRANWSCHVPWGRIQPAKHLKRLVIEIVLELL